MKRAAINGSRGVSLPAMAHAMIETELRGRKVMHFRDMEILDASTIRIGKAKQLRVKMNRVDVERIFGNSSISARITGDTDDRLTIVLQTNPTSPNRFGKGAHEGESVLTIAARHVELDNASPEGFRALQPFRARCGDGEVVMGIPPGRSLPIKKTWTKKTLAPKSAEPAAQNLSLQDQRTKALVQEINRRVSEDRDMTMEITPAGLLKVMVEYS